MILRVPVLVTQLWSPVMGVWPPPIVLVTVSHPVLKWVNTLYSRTKLHISVLCNQFAQVIPPNHVSQRAMYSSAQHCVRRRLSGEAGPIFFGTLYNLMFLPINMVCSIQQFFQPWMLLFFLKRSMKWCITYFFNLRFLSFSNPWTSWKALTNFFNLRSY